MIRNVIRFVLATGVSAMLGAAPHAAAAAEKQVERGKYLVIVAGCGDCHTQGGLTGKADASKTLGGSDVGFAVPGLGVFVGRNLTPDKATGLGNWTAKQILTALTTGVRPDGRVLAPAMPWESFAKLTRADANAIVAYLRSLPPVNNAVPGPFGPNEKPSSLVMTIVPGDVYAGLPKP